ncbi:unnamed protein product [Didymodactylos carnosus]|uniref:Uncharacterized protein n=1 Tax=Didymodactylos carnosus TaxID=1234261 RepID=A0A813SGF6_9BILA|nr:unnamed protein product [Didymodactylos carnosus]CAF1096569.1 unnamed protein product [Didymodactylos carnosus]CAF3579226.1 unnamed protein product [Didymodactylos carnosus]CAF3858034.1 unnamed protein product [Didymodactylos carnosus]
MKKAGTMVTTANVGQEFLSRSWGEDKLNKVNAILDERDKAVDGTSDSRATNHASSSSAITSGTSSVTKPKLAKHVTMAATTKEAKSLIGTEAFGNTRSETVRRKAAEKAKKTLKEVGKPQGRKPKQQQQKQTKKPALKRLGTMAQTAAAGKEYLKRGGKKSTTPGANRRGGRRKNTKKN